MLSKNAISLIQQRYAHKGETPELVLKRVAKALSLGDERFEKALFKLMLDGVFLPASPTLRNAGIKKTLLHPCHVLPIYDSIDSIFECIKNSAIIFHYGGGVGYNMSELRPKGFPLSSGGESSGVVSFLEIFDKVTDVVRQGGFRRGASLAVLDYDHPEIENFITSKLSGRLSNFNISVLVNNEFMSKINSEEKIDLKFNKKAVGSIKAKDIFDLISYSAYLVGDPGLLFYDRINQDNKLLSTGAEIKACNPCGEVPLLPWNCCNLGAINLSKFANKNSFDFKKFSKAVELGIRTLRNINSIGWYPFPEMSKQMKLNDPCGLGFLGFADCLIKLGIYYDSDEAIRFIDEICKPYVEITDRIAPESFYKRSQQPTGSLSILADASPGIEPVFHKEFERRLSVGIIEEVRSLYKSKYCRTAHEISPEWHLKIQSAFQKYIDAGVSKTCNIPNGSSVEEIRQIYIMAYKMGVKGITVFRDNCKNGQQIIVKKQSCEDGTCYL